MISVLGRSCNLCASLKITSHSASPPNKLHELIAPLVGVSKKNEAVYSAPSSTKFTNGKLLAYSGSNVSSQMRYAHTDVTISDFNAVRKSHKKDPATYSKDSSDAGKLYSYALAAGGAAIGTCAAKGMVHTFVMTLAPAADVLAMSTAEVNLSEIPEGKSILYKWRGQPVFVRHRTDEQIEIERGVDVSSLRDPQHDHERVVDPKFLVVVGVCTHLGCIPISDQGAFGGYYCPCHGSHYDFAGRIRKGPAPLNLVVPTHSYPEPGLLLIGA